MGEVTTIGLDLAKHVFQVHGVDAEGATVLRKQLRRAQVLAFFSRLPSCLVGLEACATAHYRPLVQTLNRERRPLECYPELKTWDDGSWTQKRFLLWLG